MGLDGPRVLGKPVLRALPFLIVIVAAAVAGMAWAISSPIGSSPDEDYHLASIWCPPPVETSGCQVVAGAHGTLITVPVRAVAASACYAFRPDDSAACIWKIPADKIGQDDRFDRGDYPGGFYHVMHLFARGDPYSAVYRMRAFNLALALVLGTLIVVAAARPARRILAYAVVSTMVPLGMFLIPSANPSSWAVLGVAVVGFALHSYWIAPTRLRVLANGALTIVGLTLAVSSRGDAALYVFLTAVALTMLHYQSVRRHLLRLLVPVGTAVAALVAYRSSAQASSALVGSGLGRVSDLTGWRLLVANVADSPLLLFGNEGLEQLGWLDTPMPSIVYVPMIAVCAFLVMAGLSRMSWMKAVVTGAGMVVVAAIPLYVLQVSHVQVGQGVQSRYILPLLPVVSLVLLTGRTPDQAVRLSRRAAWVAWLLASGANSVALLTNIRRYVTGMDGPLTLGGSVEWWSTSLSGPRETWIVGSLAFAAAAWMIVRLSSGRDDLGVAVEEAAHGEAISASTRNRSAGILARGEDAGPSQRVAAGPGSPEPRTTPADPLISGAPATPEPVATRAESTDAAADDARG